MASVDDVAGEGKARAWTAAPWFVGMRRFRGCTHYEILTHVEPVVRVEHPGREEDGTYWPPEHEPQADEDGYCMPDARMDCDPHRVATARLIALAPELAEAVLEVADLEQEIDAIVVFARLRRLAVRLRGIGTDPKQGQEGAPGARGEAQACERGDGAVE